MTAAPPPPPAAVPAPGNAAPGDAAPLGDAGESQGGGKENLLTALIFAGIVLALALAWLSPTTAAAFAVGGAVFLSILKMLVVPLVVTSVICGVLSMGDVRKLGRPGAATVFYYLTTTVLAVVTGLILVNLFEPGIGFDAASEQAAAAAALEAKVGADTVRDGGGGVGAILENLLTMLFTDNLFRSAADTDLLPLIVFSLALGALLTTMSARAGTLTRVLTETNDVLLKFVLAIMWLAPIGVFCLVAGQFGGEAVEAARLAAEQGREVTPTAAILELFRKTAWYSATVLTGLAVHSLVTLPLILWVMTRRNPYRFLIQMGRAILTAFATASSSATLPVTMETAVQKAGVKAKSVDFVLPLGATINMDGTALYEAVAAIFIAQTLGAAFDLKFIRPDYRGDDGDAGGDRRRGHSAGGARHADYRAERRRPAGGTRRADPLGRLAAGPLPHRGERVRRLRRRRGRGTVPAGGGGPRSDELTATEGSVLASPATLPSVAVNRLSTKVPRFDGVSLRRQLRHQFDRHVRRLPGRPEGVPQGGDQADARRR